MSVGRFTLIRGNLARRKTRSLLLVSSIAVAFFVYAVLASFEHGFSGGDAVSAERLVVTSRLTASEGLPLAHLRRIERVSAVEVATPVTRIRAVHARPDNVVGVNAVEPEGYLKLFADDFAVDPGALAALAARRDGAVVGRALAEREGWRVGQRISLGGLAVRPESGGDWLFEVVGVLEPRRPSADTNFVVVRHDYVDGVRAGERGTASWIGVRAAPGASSDVVAGAIDALFANSPHETRTQTEVAFMRAFVAQFADVSTIVRLVVFAAFAAILMIAANTMAFAVRERTREIGVLKVLGFSRAFIMGSILAETFLVFALGVGIGLALAAAALGVLAEPLGAIAPQLALTPRIVAGAVALGALLALVSGAAPAASAMRIPVLAALSKR